MSHNLLTEQLKQLPAKPGVYLMKDAENTIIYVGKASNLHNRVRSYFGGGQKLTPKVQRLVARIVDFDFFITNSEQEALILEYNLVKKYRPHYNIRLKDDKSFPYLKISVKDEWPRVYFTRRVENDGERYFGPFADARSVRQTLKVLKGIFPFRSCSREITGNDSRACLDYYINNCLAPCIGVVDKKEYNKIIKQVILFLEGKQEKVAKELKERMKRSADSLAYERAALIRDQIQAIERVIEGQKIATRVRSEQDVIAFADDGVRACVQVFFIRGSKLIGRENFVLQGIGSEGKKEIMSSFTKQFYASAQYVPPLILLQHPISDKAVIEKWLQSKRGTRVQLRVPYQGNKKQLVDIVAQNAEHALIQLKIKQKSATSELDEALKELKKELRLPDLPRRIECYDISNIQGRQAVGSMVVFEKGNPKPAHYRRFRIKTVAVADDYAMLREVLSRRFTRSNVTPVDGEASNTWSIVPDLVLIDGGKGQLNAVKSIMRDLGRDEVPVASIAKEKEEIFIPGHSEAIVLPGNSPGRQLLQRARDEAHRFALGYHQKIRRRESLTSALDAIPGIGPKRKRALLKRFGSVRSIQETPADELATAQGMNRELAQKVKEYL